MANNPRWLSFDPTIHAGHLITAATIIFCSIGAWYGVQADISTLKDENKDRKTEIVEVKAAAKEREKATEQKFDKLVEAQQQGIGKLRDDMNSWFMNLDQKLDRKADKR
ncbi:hypothetical protein P12x_005241 [Tundrisphaera lichenicola]|uniref:hypothetical protein n=1 Tax=Tundrisphaera lichenicola TaxID=2029860 RepID=UPI003EB6B014